jgi:hypothetical protein
MFEHILSYHQLHRGSIVGPEAAKYMYPTFQLCDDPAMHTEALCREVRNHRLAIEGSKKLNDIQNLIQVDPVAAIGLLNATTADLTSLITSNNTDVRVGDALPRLLHKYQLKKMGYSFAMCPWPWWPIQDATGGIQYGDYIVFYGRPKSMKSWVLAYIVAHMLCANKRGILYTKEMGADDLYQRVFACLAKLPYEGLRLGRLHPYEEQAMVDVIRMLEIAQAQNSLVCLSGQDCSNGADTVPWLRSKVEMYKPDFVAVDGMYLMSDIRGSKKDNERVRNISRDLRQMTLATNVPLIATLQANRKAAGHSEANLDEVAFSDAIGQDATHIFRVINEKDNPTCAIITGGAREFNLNGWRIFGVPATNFEFYGDLTEKDIEKATESDVGGNGGQAPPKPKNHSPREPTKGQVTTAMSGALSKP